LIFHTYIPSFPLNQFVENFVFYKDYNPVHHYERFLPDGYTNLVIDLTDSPKPIYDNFTFKEIQSCRKVWFSGIRNHYITIPSNLDNEMLIINFHKGKAYPFTGMPMNELTDYVVDGELIMSNEILNLRETLIYLKTALEKFIHTEQYLLNAFSANLNINPFVDYAANLIQKYPHQLTIAHLADKVGFSQKHLIKIFKEHVGITPKEFLRINRFQKVLGEIDAGHAINWAGIALESGYYDQAHFINDFREFSGFTPVQYLNTKIAFTNYLAVG
jgi:AraC-like DNA-binding protein